MGNSDHDTTYMRERGDDGELMETQRGLVAGGAGVGVPRAKRDGEGGDRTAGEGGGGVKGMACWTFFSWSAEWRTMGKRRLEQSGSCAPRSAHPSTMSSPRIRSPARFRWQPSSFIPRFILSRRVSKEAPSSLLTTTSPSPPEAPPPRTPPRRAAPHSSATTTPRETSATMARARSPSESLELSLAPSPSPPPSGPVTGPAGPQPSPLAPRGIDTAPDALVLRGKSGATRPAPGHESDRRERGVMQ